MSYYDSKFKAEIIVSTASSLYLLVVQSDSVNHLNSSLIRVAFSTLRFSDQISFLNSSILFTFVQLTVTHQILDGLIVILFTVPLQAAGAGSAAAGVAARVIAASTAAAFDLAVSASSGFLNNQPPIFFVASSIAQSAFATEVAFHCVTSCWIPS